MMRDSSVQMFYMYIKKFHFKYEDVVIRGIMMNHILIKISAKVWK